MDFNEKQCLKDFLWLCNLVLQMLVNKLHGFRTCNDYNVFASSSCDADIGSILISSCCRSTGIDLFLFLFASFSPGFWPFGLAFNQN